MKLIQFQEQTTIIAENQPEYIPMPAYIHDDKERTITCCWELTLRERIVLLFTGKLWHLVMRFGPTLQPQLLSIEKPVMP